MKVHSSYSIFVIFTNLIWATKLAIYCPISDREVNIVKQVQKSILFHNRHKWTKKSKPEFCKSMVAFDSEEAYELVGILLKWRLF